MRVDDSGRLGIVIEEDVKGDGFLVGAGDGEVFDFLHVGGGLGGGKLRDCGERGNFAYEGFSLSIIRHLYPLIIKNNI